MTTVPMVGVQLNTPVAVAAILRGRLKVKIPRPGNDPFTRRLNRRRLSCKKSFNRRVVTSLASEVRRQLIAT